MKRKITDGLTLGLVSTKPKKLDCFLYFRLTKSCFGHRIIHIFRIGFPCGPDQRQLESKSDV